MDTHNDSHIFNEDQYWLNHYVEDSNNPIFHSFVSRYFTCPRFDRRYHHTQFNLVPSKYSLLVRNTTSSVANSLVTCLQAI